MTPTIDYLITTYQTRLADEKEQVARTTELIITSPDDDHARSICQCDFEASVYIRRTPENALITITTY